jgi:hypothetical protein
MYLHGIFKNNKVVVHTELAQAVTVHTYTYINMQKCIHPELSGLDVFGRACPQFYINI